MNKTSFSDMLLEFRAKHNLTQRDIAKMFGVCPNMVTRYEKRENDPTAKNQIRFKNIMKEWENNNDNNNNI